jgi:hypothetical protein
LFAVVDFNDFFIEFQLRSATLEDELDDFGVADGGDHIGGRFVVLQLSG